MSLSNLSMQLKAALEQRAPVANGDLSDAAMYAATESLISEISDLMVVTKHYGLEAEDALAETDKHAWHQRAWDAIKKMCAKIVAFFKRVGQWIAQKFATSTAKLRNIATRVKEKHFDKVDVKLSAKLHDYIGDSLKLPDFGPFKSYMSNTVKFFNGASELIGKPADDFVSKLKATYGAVATAWAGGSALQQSAENGGQAVYIPAATLPGAFDIRVLTGEPKTVHLPVGKEITLSVTKAQVESYLAGAVREMGTCSALAGEVTTASDRVERIVAADDKADIKREARYEALKHMLTFMGRAGAFVTRALQVMQNWQNATVHFGSLVLGEESAVESLDGGGLPTEPVNPGKKDPAACADEKADAEGKTVPAVQAATPEHVSSQESFLGIGRTLDEKIARKEKKLGEMRAEEKRLRGEFDKEGAKHDERVFGEIARDMKELEEEIAELKAKKKTTASKESFDGDEAPVVDEATVANPEGGDKVVEVSEDDAPVESAEDALIAVNDASTQIDSSMRESSELEDAAAGLESILLAIQEQPGGLTPQDAKYVNMNLESIVGDWNLGMRLCPSYESFNGSHLRREATASLEANVREVLTQIWKYVKEMFAKFTNLIVNFYLKLTNVSRAVARRGAQLSERIDGITVDAPTKATLNIGSLAERVTVNGQMPSMTAAMVMAMAEIDGALTLENHVQGLESAVGTAAAHLRGLTDETFAAGMEQISTAYLSATKAPPIFQAKGELLQTSVFPGEISYVAEQKEGHWRYRVVKTGKSPQATAIHTPSKADLKRLAETLKVQGEKAAKGIEAITGRIKNDNGQRFLSQIEGPANNLEDKNQEAIARFVQQCAEDVKAIHALGKEMLTNAAKSMLAIVRVGELSVDLYKAPAAAAAPKEGEQAAEPAAVEAPAPAEAVPAAA